MKSSGAKYLWIIEIYDEDVYKGEWQPVTFSYNKRSAEQSLAAYRSSTNKFQYRISKFVRSL